MNEGYAIFINDDDTETKLSWDELQLKENGGKYEYCANDIKNMAIDVCTFEKCQRLKEIYFPKSIERVDGYAFCNCNHLEKIFAPKGLFLWQEISGDVKVERTNEEIADYKNLLYESEKYSKDFLEIELNNIQGAPMIFHNINVSEGKDNKFISEMFNLKDSNGNRCFNIFELDRYYNSNWDADTFEINYEDLNENIKRIIEYSEKLEIKPDLNNDIEELKEQYIKKLETIEKDLNKRNDYLEKILEKYLEQKEIEKEHVPVQVKNVERG